MFYLIQRVLPAPLHRIGLRVAFRVRHRWRIWRKVPITGCHVIVTDLQGSILLLRHSYGPDCWALPGGGVKPGEDPGKAARRELVEELGLELDRLVQLGTVDGEISGSPHTAYLFAAITDRRPRPDQREVSEARFFPAHSLPEPLGAATRAHLDAWRERRNAAR